MPPNAETKTPRTIIFHPFLFATFPVLFLYGQNIAQFSADVIIRPLAILLTATAALWGLLCLIFRNARKSALVLSLFLLLFFSYGTAYRALPEFRSNAVGIHLSPKVAALAAWGLAFAIGMFFLARTRRDLRTLNRIVNVTASALVAMSLINIVSFELFSRDRVQRVSPAKSGGGDANLSDRSELPDIYLIVLDGYPRQDILRDLYGTDNSEFLKWLEDRGFYVARESTSNYAHTIMSLGSSLNLDYLQNLFPDADPESRDLNSLASAYRRNEVRCFLKERGYQVVGFSIGAAIAELTNADVFITPGWFAEEFNNALVDMTPIWVIYQKISPAEQHRQRLDYLFERLADIPRTIRSPKFVVAHILSPHHPFVFGPDGAPIDPQPLNTQTTDWITDANAGEYRRYFAGQVSFVNRRTMEAVEAILSASARPPVIVLQADHGARSLLRRNQPPSDEALRERMSILNAYYLPGGGREDLKPDITPINTWRIILNHYFGTRYELIESRCYYSTMQRPLDFKDVTDIVRPTPSTPVPGRSR